MKGQSAMFDRKKGEDNDATPAGEATAAPPLRSKSPEANANLTPPPNAPVTLPKKPSATVGLPERPSRLAEMPSDDDGKKLVVGRKIVLKGEINSCDRLVVEGKVEAIMKDCLEIEIAESGTFKGQVEFDRADISGVFKGELTAREHLVVRSTGRISGKVRFGELEIERGGQITGDLQVFSEGTTAGRNGKNSVDKPEK